jgi:hypothetical protein
MKLLMLLCQSAAPAVAREVEDSMRAEYLKLKNKTATETRNFSTDTPVNVLESDFTLTEGGSSPESARKAPIRNAMKLASGPFWDNWVRVLKYTCIINIKLYRIRRISKIIQLLSFFFSRNVS